MYLILAWIAGKTVMQSKPVIVDFVVVVFAANGATMIRPVDVMEYLGLKDENMYVFLPTVNISLSKINIDPQIFYNMYAIYTLTGLMIENIDL